MTFFNFFKDGPAAVQSKSAAVLHSIEYWLLLAAVFILPLFFIPVSSNPLELNKLFFFYLVVFLAATLHIARGMLSRSVTFSRTFLDWFICAFLLFNLVSFFISRHWYVGAVGISGYYSSSIIAVVSFIVFFYLIVSIVRYERDTVRFLTALLGSAALIIVYNCFQVYGIHLLPWDVAENSGFNLLAGSSTTLALYIVCCLMLGLGLLFYVTQTWKRVLIGAGIALGAFLLLLLDKRYALYVIVICSFIYLLLLAFRSRSLPIWWPLVPTVLLLVAVASVYIDAHDFTSFTVSESIQLDAATSASVAWRSVQDAPFWGSGPQTFAYSFSEYRPVSFNDTVLWNVRFIKPSNEWFGLAATVGIGAVLALLALAAAFLVKCARVILAALDARRSWVLVVSMTLGWVSLFIASFFTSFNFSLHFAWWFLLALSLRSVMPRKVIDEQYAFRWSRKKSTAAAAALTLVASATVLIAFFGLRVWLADFHYQRAEDRISALNDIDDIQFDLERAIDLNPNEVGYYLTLAQGYATEVQLEASKESPDAIRLQELTQLVIDTLRRAEEVDPTNVVLYEQEAQLYDGLRNIIGNADEVAVKSYAEVIRFEPTNPLAHLNLGRARLLWALSVQTTAADDAARQQATELLNSAIVDFRHARELKQDFITADFNEGLAHQALGNLEQALSSYQRVLTSSPYSAEAYWQIALVYEQQGNLAAAIKELETYLNLDPENEQVLVKLDQLRAKAAADSEGAQE
ncbi:MAG: tetratricopeptide repeat protein [Patescibacteria group bacterium]